MHKIFGLKILIIRFILITALAAPCLADNKADVTKNGAAAKIGLKDITWLLFSDTRHQEQRDMIIKASENGINEAEKAVGKKLKIFIALKDIDGDNSDEIFSYLGHSEYCTDKGNCALTIYKATEGKLENIGPTISPYIPIDRPGHPNLIGILNGKTLNHADILIGNIVCRWTGNGYEKADK
jgi:hypothetical protein